MKRPHLEPHLPAVESEQRCRAARDPRERSWWQILWLLAVRHTVAEVTEVTRYSRYWIGQLIRRCNTQGPVGMRHSKRTIS